MQITYERVHELFRYDGKNLIRKVTVNANAQKGSVAGSISNETYRYITVDKIQCLAHRLIWMYHYGYYPENGIDHINRNKTDNRIENLREVSQSCNVRNSGNYKTNTSNVKGVYFFKTDQMWMARIRLADKHHYLGESKDFNEAVLMRYAAEQCLGWESCDKMSPAHEYALKNKLVSK